MSINPDETAKKRLFGQKKTYKELANYVASQLKSGKTQDEIAQIMGYKTRKSIYQLIQLGKTLGLYEKSHKAQQEKKSEFRFYKENEDFLKDPLVDFWVKKMKERTWGGKPVEGWPDKLRMFKTVGKCNRKNVKFQGRIRSQQSKNPKTQKNNRKDNLLSIRKGVS